MTLENNQLWFGEDKPVFGPLPVSSMLPGAGPQTIISRGISTIFLSLNFQIQVNYTLITANTLDCLNTGLSLPQLQYRVNGSLNWTIIETGELYS